MARRRIARPMVAEMDLDDPIAHRRQEHEGVGPGLGRLEGIEGEADCPPRNDLRQPRGECRD